MRVLLRFACGFVAAAFLALLLLTGPYALIPGLVLLPPAVFLTVRRRGAGYLLLGLCVGLLWTLGFQTLEQRTALMPAETPVPISGTAVDYSEATAYGVKVPAVISDGAGRSRAMIWLNTRESLAPGDRFTVSAVLRDSTTYSSYYRSEGIGLLAYGKGEPELMPADRIPLRYLPRWIAHRLEESLSAAMPEDVLGYGAALTTGNRAWLTNGEKRELRVAGIYHALALSGMHMAVLMGMVTALTRKKRRRALIGIPLCLSFALITGGSPSVVRAAVMQCMLLLAPLAGREEDRPTSLGLAALVLTAQNPWCVLGWSMQLSFASMGGIVLLGEPIYDLISGGNRGKKRQKLRHWLCASLSTTAAAGIFVTPLMMAYFGQISLVTPVTNLLTLWAVGWCFRGSLLTALTGLILPGLAEWMGWLLAWPIRYIQWVAEIFARLPFASLSTESVYGMGWVLLMYLLLFILWRTRGRNAVIPLSCAAVGLVVALGFLVMDGQRFTITVLDVGQGQCVLCSGQGQTVMVDCGGTMGQAVGDQAADCLAGMGLTRLDALILTHYDQDHVGGVAELLDQVEVTRVLMPDLDWDRRSRLEIEAAALNQGVELLPVAEDTVLRAFGGLVQIFPTEPGDNASLGILFDTGETRLLITGDMDEDQERRMLNTWEIPPVDVLIAGHHGAEDSTSQALLDAARPRIVAISVGKNSYGHPAEETLARILASGAAVYRTDLHGTIRLKGA